MKCFQSHLRTRLPNTLSTKGSHCSARFNLSSWVFFLAKVQEVRQLWLGAAVYPWKHWKEIEIVWRIAHPTVRVEDLPVQQHNTVLARARTQIPKSKVGRVGYQTTVSHTRKYIPLDRLVSEALGERRKQTNLPNHFQYWSAYNFALNMIRWSPS